MPSDASSPGKPERPRCRARKKTGEQCRKYPIAGATVCRVHGGSLRHVKRKAAVRAEVFAWGLNDVHVDPGETLLRLVSQSARRADLYADLLQRAFDAAERIRQAAEESSTELDAGSAGADAQRDLDDVLATGGVGALIGKTYSATEGKVYASGEAVRGLAKLEAEERDRCAGFATKVVAAGIAERQVRLAERQGQMVAELLTRLVTSLGHDPRDPAVAALVTRELAVIEGSVA